LKEIRFGILAVSVIVTIGQFIIIDYTHLDSSKNAGSYLNIFSLIYVIIALIASIKYDKKTKS
jgi:hypothetical protein